MVRAFSFLNKACQQNLWGIGFSSSFPIIVIQGDFGGFEDPKPVAPSPETWCEVTSSAWRHHSKRLPSIGTKRVAALISALAVSEGTPNTSESTP